MQLCNSLKPFVSCTGAKLEPIMLKNLTIIPSRTSQNFYQLFLSAPPIISCLFYCVNDNITMQE